MKWLQVQIVTLELIFPSIGVVSLFINYNYIDINDCDSDLFVVMVVMYEIRQ